jgi:hypothetical protein
MSVIYTPISGLVSATVEKMKSLSIPVYSNGKAATAYNAIVADTFVVIHMYAGINITTTYVISSDTSKYGRSGPETAVDTFLVDSGITHTVVPGSLGGRRRRSAKRHHKRRRSTRKN